MTQDHTPTFPPATDPTVPALDLTTAFATSEPAPTTDDLGRRPRRVRRLAAAAVVLALVGTGVGVVASGGGSSSTPQAGAQPTTATGPAAGPTPAVPAAADLAPAEGPQGGQPQAQPEPEPPAEPGVLVVSTDEINLPDGWYTGSFQVRNEGASPLAWHWQAGGYGIAVSQNGGTLEPGEWVVVSFTINPFQLQEGDFTYDNAIFDDQVSLDLRINGHRNPIVVNPNIPPGPQNIKP